MYKKMADILKPVKVGTAEIDIMDYTNRKLGFMESMSGLGNEKYARLRINGETYMSETPMEQRTNIGFVISSFGDVLMGGLGIGMILLAIQDKSSVNSITVIENSQDVIDTVAPQLPLNDKVRIIHDDVFTWKPDQQFDCIYMDILSHINSEIYNEMKKLKRKYGHYLKPNDESPNRFNECWCEYEAKKNMRLI